MSSSDYDNYDENIYASSEISEEDSELLPLSSKEQTSI